MFYFASLFKLFKYSENNANEGAGVEGLLAKAESRLLYQPANERHDVDLLFIHDAVVDPDEAWRCSDVDELWPMLLVKKLPRARIVIYQYERTWVKSLADIVCPEHLRKISKDLLEFLGSGDRMSSVPLVVFAHGFGGLLYEQALVWSDMSDSSNVLRNRKHTAFLFGTPHFGAGIAEWAIIIAQLHGISCAQTAQTQDWSSLRDKISETSAMQRQFREILERSNSKVKLIGCFSELKEPKMASEWVVLPEFIPIAVNRGYSSITRLDSKDDALKAITINLVDMVYHLS
ncbi:hypothetical protein GGR51DRAFT_81300 [Nemania sp. FL0031]|nr:hypothetical protein GGR51DRAFT_81300 [Nemania sp. FL0031]